MLFRSRGEPVIFVGYPTNQKGYLVWCPGRGPTKVVATNNVVFGTHCPYSSRSGLEIIPPDKDLDLAKLPSALTLKEVDKATDLHILGIFDKQLFYVIQAFAS